MSMPNVTNTSQDYAAGATAISAPRSVFEAVPDLAIYRSRWLERCACYQVLRAYYEGRVYDRFPELAKALKLYSGIRQIFGPLKRAVRVDVAKVPGGWTYADSVPKAVQAGVDQVRTWSKHESVYSRAVLYGAVAGEFGLLVVDNQLARTVTIEPLRPDEVVVGTLADGTPFGLIMKPGLVDRAGMYEYASLITPTTITTYRNGEPHDFGGGATRPNLQRRVPLILSPFLAGENGIGENSFTGTQELLDRVNDAASQALDVIQRNAEPLTVFSGVTDVKFEKENNAIVLTSPDSKAYTLVPNLVIDQALALIERVLLEFKNLLPQLVFDDLRARNDLAYDTVLTLCSELIDHVRDIRTHVDAAIVQAEQWALEAMTGMGLWSGNASLHALDRERPVIEPSPTQKIGLEMQKINLERARNPQPAPTAPPETPNGVR